jgi:hypothetical protein
MARKTQTKGACTYCGREMTRGGMARHLATCEQRANAIAVAQGKKGGEGTWIHLQVQDAWRGDYWLHLEMDATATLKQLDSYLRAIWLECCGHLSEFSAGGAWSERKVGMQRKAGQVFHPGVALTHIYDFGTSSETLVKAVGERNGPGLTKRAIALMARNAPPVMTCMECDHQATHLCMECIYEDEAEGTLCDEHVEEHEHDDYGEPTPIVNSPRMGLCGYSGPADPPY